MAPNPQDDATKEKLAIEQASKDRSGALVDADNGVVLNASGHKDQLARQYGLLGICGLALNIDNAWIALGGSVTIAIGEQRSSAHKPPTAPTLTVPQRTAGPRASCTSSSSRVATMPSSLPVLQRSLYIRLPDIQFMTDRVPSLRLRSPRPAASTTMRL